MAVTELLAYALRLDAAEAGGADFSGASLDGANFSMADLQGARFRGAKGVDKIIGLDSTTNRDSAVFE